MILLTAATGQIGRQVLDNVLGSGEAVRVLVRDPSRLAPSARERVEVVEGSMTDAEVLAEAFAGADSVFWLLPPDPKAESVEGHTLAFARPLREALAGQSSPRLVYVSGLGPKPSEDGAPGVDEMIAATGCSYRALPCPAFMDNLLQQVEPIRRRGVFSYPISGDRKLPTCASRDIAAVAAELLLDDSWSGPGRVPILGPEDLSYDEMADIMTTVLARPIRFERVPQEAFKATLTQHGVSEPWAQGLVERMARVDQGLYNAEPRTPRSTTSTSFRRWCEEVLKPTALG